MSNTGKQVCDSEYCQKYHYHCPGCGFLLSKGAHVTTCAGLCGGCGKLVRFIDFEHGWELVTEEPKR